MIFRSLSPLFSFVFDFSLSRFVWLTNRGQALPGEIGQCFLFLKEKRFSELWLTLPVRPLHTCSIREVVANRPWLGPYLRV